MKRLLMALLLLPTLAWSATKYVDNGCTNNGDGTAINCAAVAGQAGPWNSMDNALASWSCGDTVNVRGDHATHGSNHGGATINGTWGVYRTDRWNITNDCTGNPLIIQANGWTADGAATQETVYTQAVKTLASGDWTECIWTGTCDCGAIGDGSQTACTQTWAHTKSGDGANRVYWGVKPDYSITPRKATLGAMTAQYDADNPDGTSTIHVRWGASLPSDPSVNFSNNGNQWFCNGCKFITIRGFRIWDGIRAAISANSTSSNVTFEDNILRYFNDGSNGSARPFENDSGTSINVIANEFAYTSSEPIHVSTLTLGTVSGNIKKNWVHNIGDLATMGNAAKGTPNCTTFTNDASSGNPTSGIASPWDTGNDNGIVFDSNILDTCNEQDTTKATYGIYLESTVKNAVFSNNIITGVSAAIEIRPAHSTPINGGINGINTNTFYNNLAYGLALGAHDTAGECFNLNPDGNASPSAAINGNVFWNNTCMDVIDFCIGNGTGTGLGNTTTNTFANNICQKASLSSPTDFLANHLTQGITVKNNVVWSGKASGECGKINNAAVNCGSTGCEVCADPLVVSAGAHNYHIQSGSPAKDAGTSSGLPAGRTKDICNSIASSHSLPSYNDCATVTGTPDIGIDELVASDARRRHVKIISDLIGVWNGPTQAR